MTDGEEGRDGSGVLATGICTSLPAACAQGNEHDAESTETTYRCPLSDCINSIHLICGGTQAMPGVEFAQFL